jgi:hypothetical protein
MKQNILIGLILVFFAVWIFQTCAERKSTYELQKVLYKQIQAEKQFQDSVLKRLNDYKPPDLTEINNHYTNIYEKQSNIIKSFSVDQDVQFFSKWYNTIK